MIRRILRGFLLLSQQVPHDLVMDEIEPHRDEKIGKQDCGITNHDRIGGSATHPLGPSGGIHPLKTADGDDKHTEEKGLDQTNEKIEIMHVIFDRIVVAVGCHFKKIDGDEVSPKDPHHNAKNS